MGKYAQLVMGPAGSGKSTYCETIFNHLSVLKRSSVHVVNLDPAAERFAYPVSIDIRDLIGVEDAVESMNFGPNGGLVYCMEVLSNSIEWLTDELGDFSEDYLIFDCPGQIELYTHLPFMKRLIGELQRQGYNIVALYMMDSHFITESAKFISGALMCLSAMIQLEVPHINVLTKMDLIDKKGKAHLIEKFLETDIDSLMADLVASTPPRLQRLNAAIGKLLEDYSLVKFVPLDIKKEDSVSVLLQHADNSLQFGEDEEPREFVEGEEE